MKSEEQLADELIANVGLVRTDWRGLFILVIAGALIAMAGDDVDLVALIALGAIVLVLLLLIMLIGLRSIRVQPAGLVIRYPLQRPREVAWEEIEQFNQHPWLRCLTIRAGGRRVYFNSTDSLRNVDGLLLVLALKTGYKCPEKLAEVLREAVAILRAEPEDPNSQVPMAEGEVARDAALAGQVRQTLGRRAALLIGVGIAAAAFSTYLGGYTSILTFMGTQTQAAVLSYGPASEVGQSGHDWHMQYRYQVGETAYTKTKTFALKDRPPDDIGEITVRYLSQRPSLADVVGYISLSGLTLYAMALGAFVMGIRFLLARSRLRS